MRQLHHIAIYTLLLLAALSCRKQETPAIVADSPEAASLTLTVEIPKISLATKSASISSIENGHIVSDPFGNDLANWTDNEKLIDGRLMYRLTIFLINRETGYLAGYRDIYLGSEDFRGSSDTQYGANGFKDGNTVIDKKYGEEAVISFKYDHPLHNISQDDGHTETPISPEQLDRGEYRIIAVANWAPVDLEIQNEGTTVTQTYPGITDHDGNEVLTGYVESLKNEFKAQTPTKHKLFRDYERYQDLLDCTLHSDPEQFLCDLTPQPLILVQDFVLDPGENYVSLQLKRCWARIRVTVENISNHDLTVHSLSFGDNTTKDETFLFAAPGNEEATLPLPSPGHEHASYGAPKIEEEEGLSHYNALKSFKPETIIPGLDLSSADAVQDNISVLFDGYILESDGNGQGFSYNLNLEYERAKTDHLMRVKKADGSWDIITDNIEDIKDGGLYVIQGRGSKKYVIQAGANSLILNKDMNNSSYYIDDKYTEFSEDLIFRFVRDTKTPSQEVNARRGGKEEIPERKVTFPRYWIQTYDKKYWWGTPASGNESIKLVAENPTSFIIRNDGVFTANIGKENEGESNILFWSTEEDPNNKGTYGYVNISGSISNLINGWAGDSKWPGDDDGSQFHLNKVELETREAHFNDKVTLSVTDPVTAASSPVKAIRRNDFINIYITASYSDKSGEFKFEVMDWNNKDFDIDFE